LKVNHEAFGARGQNPRQSKSLELRAIQDETLLLPLEATQLCGSIIGLSADNLALSKRTRNLK
jgi:hypothetical protein